MNSRNITRNLIWTAHFRTSLRELATILC